MTVRQLRSDDLERTFPPAELALGVEWLVRQQRGEMYIAVAELDGELIGRNCLELNHAGNSALAYLFAGTTRPQWRSHGIGRRVLAHIEDVAQASGVRAIRTVVEKTNHRSRAWLERQGYRQVGEGRERWTEGDGRFVEVECWKLEHALTNDGRGASGRG